MVIHRDLKVGRAGTEACGAASCGGACGRLLCCQLAAERFVAALSRTRVPTLPILPPLYPYQPNPQLENVMLTEVDTSLAAAKLGDFGLARLTPPAERQMRARL